jgi:hypothetical protein
MNIFDEKIKRENKLIRMFLRFSKKNLMVLYKVFLKVIINENIKLKKKKLKKIYKLRKIKNSINLFREKRKIKYIINEGIGDITYFLGEKNYLDKFKNLKFYKQNINFYVFFKRFINQVEFYKIFPIDLYKFFKFLKNIEKIDELYANEFNKINYNKKLEKKSNLIITPLKHKLKRRKYLDRAKAILYGFKFHFKGRFRRKQKAASL